MQGWEKIKRTNYSGFVNSAGGKEYQWLLEKLPKNPDVLKESEIPRCLQEFKAGKAEKEDTSLT